MPSKRETVLTALHARLQTLAAPVLRGDVLPERIPATGLIILRDGKPGEPEVTLSPLTYFYEHRAEWLCCTNQSEVEFSLLLNRVIPRAEFAAFRGP